MLSCDLSSSVYSTKWQYLTRQIHTKSGRREKYEEKTNKSHTQLTIRDVKFNDAGNYSCLQYFSYEKPRKTVFTLQIQGELLQPGYFFVPSSAFRCTALCLAF